MNFNTLLLIVFIMIIIICIVFIIIKTSRNNKYVWVYPKTGNHYIVLTKCKMKIHSTGEWIDALIYQAEKDGMIYVRETTDFIEKFIPLKDWKDGNKNK